jgi:flagellar basal-body rod modification protein FlgD
MTSPVDGVGPTATLPASYDPTTAKVNASGTGKPTPMFDSEMFLNLLVAQLKYQDPTNPVDTSNFMNQTAMLSQVQTMNSMSDTLSQMMTAQQTASATSMIGKAISFVDPAGKQASGIVDGVSFSKGAAMLHVGSLAVPLSGVLAVADPVAAGGSAADSTGGSTDGTGTVDAVGDATATAGDTTAGTATADGTTPTAAGGAPSDSSPDPQPTTAGAPATTIV